MNKILRNAIMKRSKLKNKASKIKFGRNNETTTFGS